MTVKSQVYLNPSKDSYLEAISKCDVKSNNKEVSPTDGQQLCTKWSTRLFFNTSAKEDVNIAHFFFISKLYSAIWGITILKETQAPRFGKFLIHM